MTRCGLLVRRWCSLLDFNQRGISPPGYKAGAIERTMRSEQNFIYKTTQSRQPLERRGNVAVGEWFCRQTRKNLLQPVLGARGARREEKTSGYLLLGSRQNRLCHNNPILSTFLSNLVHITHINHLNIPKFR